MQIIRSCVNCRQRFEKKDLHRFVLVEGKPMHDETGKKNGRGTYLCDTCIMELGDEKEKLKIQGKIVRELSKKKAL